DLEAECALHFGRLPRPRGQRVVQYFFRELPRHRLEPLRATHAEREYRILKRVSFLLVFVREARAFDRRELWVRQPGRVVEVQQLALVARGEDAQGVLEVLVLAKTLQIVRAVDLTEDPGLHNLCRTEVQVVRIFVLGGAVEKQTELDRGRLLPG